MTTRAQRAAALERWADEVDGDDLVEAKTAALRTIAELVEQRDDIDSALLGANRDARNADRSWSEIGAMPRRVQAGRPGATGVVALTHYCHTRMR